MLSVNLQFFPLCTYVSRMTTYKKIIVQAKVERQRCRGRMPNSMDRLGGKGNKQNMRSIDS